MMGTCVVRTVDDVRIWKQHISMGVLLDRALPHGRRIAESPLECFGGYSEKTSRSSTQLASDENLAVCDPDPAEAFFTSNPPLLHGKNA